MSKISRDFIAKAKAISSTCENQNMVYTAMKHIMDQTLRYQHSIYITDLYRKLTKLDIGTTTVEGLSEKVCRNLPQKRGVMLIRTVMKWKLTDAEGKQRKERYRNTKVWREEKRVIKSRNILQQFNDIWREEKQHHKAQVRKKLKRKIEFLKKKHTGKSGRNAVIPDVIDGIIVKDQEISEEHNTDPRIYGSVELNEQEKSALGLPPRYAVYEKVDVMDCEIEIEKALGKFRWETRRRESTETNAETVNNHDISVYDEEKKTFNFRKLKPSDLPFNRRINLPGPLAKQTEIKLQNLKNDLIEVTKGYVEDKKQGGGKSSNLSKDQREGIKSLQGRCKEKSIVVFQTDKSGRFSVDSMDNYMKSCKEHVENDKVVTPEDHDRHEKEANAHATMWIRMLEAGKDTNSQTAIKGNMLSHNSAYAPLYGLRKDHKRCTDANIGPPTRPVCGGNVSFNHRLSYLMSNIVKEAITDEDSPCTSTEEMIAEIKRVNREGIPENFIIGSADVKALYPSLDINFTIEKVCEVLKDSKIRIENGNYKEVTLYVALQKTQNEIRQLGLGHICPSRKSSRGPKPNITGSGTKANEKERYAPWIFKNISNISEEEKRHLIVTSLEICMKFLMTTHTYVFNNQLRQQSTGGAIGMELTGVLAQVFMVWYDKELRRALENMQVELILYKRYVDDINAGMRATPIGLRKDREMFYIDETLAEQDRTKQEDERTMEFFKEIGSAIHPSIQLEIEYPSKHEDNKMPILDLKVWIQEVETSPGIFQRQIMYEHYVKPTATRAVIYQSSALPNNIKRTVATQEILRILLNCSEFLPTERLAEHISEMTKRLQMCGYGKKFRYDVVKSALEAHKRIKREEIEGKRPVHRPKNWNRTERIHKKRRKKHYKQQGYDAILFVPSTPNSKMKEMYKTILKNNGISINVVEKSGRSVKSMLQRSNPFKEEKCNRELCLTCNTGGKGPCTTEGITYDLICEDGCEIGGIYRGESSNNAYTRGIEHRRLYDAGDKTSVMLRHVNEKHDGVRRKYKMTVTGKYRRDAMKRQIAESVAIENTAAERLINTRSEWNKTKVPRAKITT